MNFAGIYRYIFRHRAVFHLLGIVDDVVAFLYQIVLVFFHPVEQVFAAYDFKMLQYGFQGFRCRRCMPIYDMADVEQVIMLYARPLEIVVFLVKTDATDYVWGDKAIGYYQAGEEGQAIVGGFIGGFVPTVAAVPEPSEYALMMLGLGVVGFVAARRKKQNLA